jgi:ANTAR domain
MQATTIRSDDSIYPLLALAVAQANAQGAYVYQFDRHAGAAWLAVWAGLPPGRFGGARPPLRGRMADWWLAQSTPIVLWEGACSDWRFEHSFEFATNRFEGVVSVPLVDSGAVVGMANICRSRRLPIQPRELSFLLSLSLPLGALVAGAAAREKLTLDLEKLMRQLADQKLLDRAKGLLQSRYGWSEEQAYLYLRRLSRQNRVPKRESAQWVIENGGARRAEGATAHAE